MKWVPFTVHIKITPSNPDKRFELVRDMQKIAALTYEGLETLVPGTISIATPGGGQHTSRGGTQAGGKGGMTPGLAVKPQFGEAPAQMMITGFYDTANANIQPQPSAQRISGGEIYTSNASQAWNSGPNATINSQAAALKSTLEAAIGAALPGAIDFSIFRLDYCNVIYGDRGHHFP